MKEILQVCDHALAASSLAVLRNQETSPAAFRLAVRRITTLLTLQATQDLPTHTVTVETPLCATPVQQLAVRVGIVPILRAGLGMVEPVLDLLPEAEVWHLGLYRDEQTLEPVTYYAKLPPDTPVDVALVLDPMLATGGSACAAIEKITAWGVPDIRFLGILAAPEGVKRLQADYPGVPMHVAALDNHLNDQGYIVPGLGDAGDRTFNAIAT
jgi:uracil phosphoribosyltransferase